jgi:SAM-dependent methyltransferase
LILDVGCGVNPRGDVNVDFVRGGDYGQYRTRADVIASAESLPFRDESFDCVHFHGLLHHLRNPESGWKEILRVTRDIVVGVEPNYNLIFPRDPTESYHTFRKRALTRIVKPSEKFDVKIERTLWARPLRLEFRILAMRRIPKDW